jgi:hypothetical protein
MKKANRSNSAMSEGSLKENVPEALFPVSNSQK